ncbi:mycofactocin biosynthesis peptidyl-dipeptidase MftE [Mycobacterium sp. ITM-2016-00316]|uniref:mycofactocin biosynthesis peptidyl-dipeptidase MftE n=1 Tax=Mycobacterium sp. ITM-2016-00316 TaxID=2099695 RepID=UPI000CF94891|nr:mycofactocin biosynthesis peptidyl-dipeptidase MftE [Mycobacterium sp. ITM-2016-00316]WNG82992.1 mycofactocin biosynthesis peptidyl-dipeptidase MftE [Mycobacterium sp. ITM-2016-00316]
MNSAYHHRVAVPGELGGVTSSGLLSTARHQQSDGYPALIVPLGSTEQHGPHLPLDTDTRIASAVARAVAARLGSGWLLAPALSYGASGEHEGFAGTVSIGTEALRLLLVEFGRSACIWATRLVFVNGHGGNVEALAGAVGLLRTEGRDVSWSPCMVPGADAHAGHTETSVLLHISPEAVHTENVVAGNSAPLAELMPAMRAGGVAAVSAVGVLGDPTTASAVEGEQYFAEMVDGCARKLLAWTPNGHGMLT